MPDALELDPVGMGKPVDSEARRGRRPLQESVARAPHDPHWARDLRRIESVARAERVVDQRAAVALRRPDQLVGQQLRRDVLVVARS